MSQMPTLEEQARFYDRWNASCRTGEFEAISDEIRCRAEEVLKHLGELGVRDARILEIGCGTGWLTHKLNSFGPVTAVDLSPAAVRIARERDTKARYIAGDIFQCEFDDASFDVVVCVETLFYVEDQKGLINLIGRCLKPQGILALTNINKFVYDRSSDVGRPEEGQVRHWLSRRAVNALLAQEFDVYKTFTIAPRGDRGILRVLNSRKLNAALQVIVSRDVLARAKELAGLGGGVVTFARRRVA